VDIFRWPWLRGQEPSGSDPEQVVERLEAAIRPQHHLVDLGTGSELLLIALGRRPARSLSVAGFFASAATLKTAGEHGLAAAVLAVTALSVTPAQIVRIAMQGADEDETREAVASVEASVDTELFAERHSPLSRHRFHGPRPDRPAGSLPPGARSCARV
jgi:phosphotransferase system HPr-like phosphotransfer protein